MDLLRIKTLAGIEFASKTVVSEGKKAADVVVTVNADGSTSIETEGVMSINGAAVHVTLTESEKETDAKENKPVKVKVPSDIAKAITSRISELKAAIEEFDNKGYNDDSVKQNAIDALEQIASDLKQEDGKAKATVFIGTLMSPIIDLLPPKLVKFLHSAPTKPVKEAYNRDFQQNDDVAHNRLYGILKKLEEKLEFANPEDKDVNSKIAGWVQHEVGQAFWSSVADYLREKGFRGAASDLDMYASESGY